MSVRTFGTATVLLVLALYSCVATVGVQGNSQLFPERFRDGQAYERALSAERHHHGSIGFTPNTTANFFNQFIFHNDPSVGTFADKFYYDMTYYNKSGPIGPLCMMYLNGEAPLNGAVGGYMADIAQAVGACTLTIEHRWYGVSLPGPLTDKDLLTRSLTVNEAMEDVVALMRHFEQQIIGTTPTWMLVGGSYSGAVTVWMNEKYPGLFKASWAASGVVRATFDYTDYDGHVKEVVSRECGDALSNVMRIAEEKWETENARLRQLFNIPTYNGKTDMMWAMADASASSVQYSMKDRMCNSILPPAAGGDWAVLQQYATMVVNEWGPNFMASCYYSTECLSNSSYAAQWGPAGYSWIWECCNEVAYWQTGYPGSIRSPNVTTSYFIDQCRSAFYNDTFPDTWAFNKRHHGLHPQTLGNIVATQGSDDPWSTTGLRVSQGPTFPVNTAQCDNCGHCGSMMSPRTSDPANLQAQRALVLSSLKQWLFGG